MLATSLRLAAFLASWLLLLPAMSSLPAQAGEVQISPYVSPECAFLAEWHAALAATHQPGDLVPLKLEPTDAQLAQMGLPPREALAGKRFPVPTMVFPDGRTQAVDPALVAPRLDGPALAVHAGAGCLGIRPGALLLNLNDGVSLCSMAHVYGAAGSYQISTAGHCTRAGEVVTVVAAVGDNGGAVAPILLDFGKTARSIDNGPGRDWALISVLPAYQELVSPTMCVWAGPRGTFTATGRFASVDFGRDLVPSVATDPDPELAQGLVHYGHGVGLGAGVGTARSGVGVTWGATSFTFVGAISPGDSGSGANVATGEAAGVITHLVYDPFLSYGLGTALGTRATQVPADLADGQLVPYPVPVPGAP